MKKLFLPKIFPPNMPPMSPICEMWTMAEISRGSILYAQLASIDARLMKKWPNNSRRMQSNVILWQCIVKSDESRARLMLSAVTGGSVY